MIRRIVTLSLAVFFVLFLLAVAAFGLHWLQAQNKLAQPIAFPHTVHAGRLGLACDFCHESVATSRHAGVPAVGKCLSCHETIAADRPEIIKLKQYPERKEDIHWKQIHALPDFIYFSHKRHVRAELSCAACHGQVEAMTVVKPVRSLQMGWCVSCHRTTGAPLDCATCHK